MAFRPHGRAVVDPDNPDSFAKCDRCGDIVNHSTLRFQYQWAGQTLQNQGRLVCDRCYDVPAAFLKTLYLPPDPEPTLNSRPEPYALDVISHYTLSGAPGARLFRATGATSAIVSHDRLVIPIYSATGVSTASAQAGRFSQASFAALGVHSPVLKCYTTRSAAFSATGNSTGVLSRAVTQSAVHAATGSSSSALMRYVTRAPAFSATGASSASLNRYITQSAAHATTGGNASTLTKANLWTPSELGSAVKVWWDASISSTITHSSGAVSSWASRVGSITADQSTADYKPTYSATVLNSRPGITFDGSNDILTFSATTGLPSGGDASVIFLVGKSNVSDDGIAVYFGYGDVSGSGKYRIVYAYSGSEIRGDYHGGGVNSTVSCYSSSRVSVFESTGTPDSSLTIDGGTPITDASHTYNTVLTGGAIGARFDSSYYAYFTIQECGIISGTITTSDRQKLEGYLAWKWGVNSNLPSGHPYYSAAPTV